MSFICINKFAYRHLPFKSFLPIENFPFNTNFQQAPEFETGILTGRFPLSAEDQRRSKFEIDQNLFLTNQIVFIISKVILSQCAINLLLEYPDPVNTQYSFRWFGNFPEKDITMI